MSWSKVRCASSALGVLSERLSLAILLLPSEDRLEVVGRLPSLESLPTKPFSF